MQLFTFMNGWASMSLTKDEQYFFDYFTRTHKMYLKTHTGGPNTWGIETVAQCCGAHAINHLENSPKFNGMLMELSKAPRPELIEEKIGFHSPGDAMRSYMQHISIPIEE